MTAILLDQGIENCHGFLIVRVIGRKVTDLQFDNLELELSALDLHYLDVNTEAVKLLDEIRVISRPHGLDPKLIGFLVITNIRDIKCLRAILVLSNGDVTSCGHVHDLGRVFLGFFENGMGFREPLDLLQDSSTGLIVLGWLSQWTAPSWLTTSPPVCSMQM